MSIHSAGPDRTERQMNDMVATSLAVGEGSEARRIAVLARPGASPGLFWLGGFRSDMTGGKATAIDALAAEEGLAATRFDYSGHGQSTGAFTDGTISRWLDEALHVYGHFTSGPQIVIGSSMGGWIALLLAEKLRATRPVAGLVLIAPAVDMTRALMWEGWSEGQRSALMTEGVVREPSEYSDEPYVITRKLIEDGDRHLFGDRLIEAGCPVHILQGMADSDVPWRHAEALVGRLASDDVVFSLVKDGDHRLSRSEDIGRLRAAVTGLVAEVR